MAMFLVVLRQSGPEFDRARPLEEQSGWPAHAAFMDGLVDDGLPRPRRPAGRRRPRGRTPSRPTSEEAVRATLARDPWSETHLRVDAIEPWTIRLDARQA